MGDLARRLVACPEWRWAPGMHLHDTAGHGAMVVLCHPSGALVVRDGGVSTLPVSPEFLSTATPDLSDAATAGCLLSWLPGPCSAARSSDGQHSVWVAGHLPTGWHPTLGEAAASALISLWEVNRG